MKYNILIGILLMLAMGCQPKVITTQYSDTSPVRAVNETVTKSGKHEHRTVTVDSTPQYRECLSDMNRRELGAYAVQYCQCLTSPQGDEKACASLLPYGASAFYGAGYQSAFGPVSPMGYGPADGGWMYQGSAQDPAVTYNRLAASGQQVQEQNYVTRGEAVTKQQMRPVVRQVADNAAAIQGANAQPDQEASTDAETK